MKKLIVSFFLCLALGAMAGDVISLNGEWTLNYWEQPPKAVNSPDEMSGVNFKTIKATVPGNTQLDLYKAGIVPDPYIGSNVFDLRKWEGYQWCYSRTFTVPVLSEGQSARLHFGGIDCYAEIFINGKHVGSTANAMIDHYLDVTDEVRQGAANELKVIIRSTVLEKQNEVVGTFGIACYPSSETWLSRVPPHSVGWDIVPRLIGIGLWRDVELEILDPTHFTDIHHYVTRIDASQHTAMLMSDVQMCIPHRLLDNSRAAVTVSLNGEVKGRQEMEVTSSVLRFAINVPDAQLWWPLGYGEHPLYDVKVTVTDFNGNLLAEDTKKIGLRMVKVDRNEINTEENPGKFRFIINGEPIYMRGTNWIPLDAFHSRDKEKYEQAIAEAVDLGVNMIRCWGGNVYEDTRFFELCDENGIMVWQDFAMACTFYSQRESFARAIEEEVTSVVLKLRNHCSLALWCGNNEDDMYHRLVHGDLRYDPNDDRISRHVIPRVLYEFDFTRPYLPSSPYYSRETVARGGADKYKPEEHLWWVGYHKDDFYTGSPAEFVSEVGMRSFPNVESIKRMMPRESWNPRDKDGTWNKDWEGKTTRDFKSWIGNYTYQPDYMTLHVNQIKLMFGEEPKTLEDLVFASQATQAEAFKYWIEMWRSRKWVNKTGLLWWNMREGWPNISTGLVDYYGTKKLGYKYVQNSHKDVCVMVSDVVRKGSLALVAVNDTSLPVSGNITITDVESGRKVYDGKYDVPANGRTDLGDLPSQDGMGVLKISYTVGDKKQENHYLYGTAPYNLAKYKELMRKSALFEIK